MNIVMAQNIESKQSTIPKLEQAQFKFGTQLQRQNMEQAMQKTSESSRATLNQLEGLEIAFNEANLVQASGTAKAKLFGLIEFDKKHEYIIYGTGMVHRKQNMFNFMWKYQDQYGEVV